MKTISQIRSNFIDYFVQNGHKSVPSSSLVPNNDATLMFTNAGMVQFKNVFTGLEVRDYTRAVTAQKCVRAGGKHNDLDNVGYTARHHTFFEMLGNFSFGDYFKEEAIYYAWDFLTNNLCLPKEKLLVTVYHTDDEARNLWKMIAGLSDEKIINIPTSDNFWSMGDVGPCGPCSEIFYDHGEHILGGPPGSADEDGDRFIEIWNLVFMQYDQIAPDKRVNLPKPSIDTGAGIERLASVLQHLSDNYQTDLFKHLITSIEDVTSLKSNDRSIASYKVIADHLRSMSFLIADGVSPSNEGRGYVLRRIMRRAMRHSHLLGAKEPMIWKLLPTLVELMGSSYPELLQMRGVITETIRGEEERFGATLHRGLEILNKEISALGGAKAFSGEVAFKLYDTYGFPLDLTQDILRGHNISVDIEGFNKQMVIQQERARANWIGSGDLATEKIWFDIKNDIGDTEFCGYDHYSNEATIKCIIKGDSSVDDIAEGDECYVLLDKSTFYAESGGQASDVGYIKRGSSVAEVIDVQKKLGGVFAHKVKVLSGSFRINEIVLLSIDEIARKRMSANHSATHLLHKALREKLGNSVAQKGSSITADRLRFDFAYNKPLTSEEINEIEQIVNKAILENSSVNIENLTKEEAISKGAMALFGEKYGDVVRMVSMGSLEGDDAWSRELCGGTHVSRTGDIGLFVISSQGSVSSGVRRIEALTGLAALNYIQERNNCLNQASVLLQGSYDEICDKISLILSEKKHVERELKKLQQKLVSKNNSDIAISSISGTNFSYNVLDNLSGKDLKALIDKLLIKINSGIIALFSKTDEGKVSVVVGLTKDLTSKYNAVDFVRAASVILGGNGGGGRPDLAQAGGCDTSSIDKAIEKIKSMI